MAFFLELKYDKRKWKKVRDEILAMPKDIQQGIEKRWNVLLLDFRRLMQDKHLNAPPGEGPNPYRDKLRRQTSLLYRSLSHDVTLKGGDVNASVFFIDKQGERSPVSDYAPPHEFGDPKRNIPARMNLRKEWKGFQVKFFDAANEVIAKEFK